MNWSELRRGDVLVDKLTGGRHLDYLVILILAPPRDGLDIEYVSLISGARHRETMINADVAVENEWTLVRSP